MSEYSGEGLTCQKEARESVSQGLEIWFPLNEMEGEGGMFEVFLSVLFPRLSSSGNRFLFSSLDFWLWKFLEEPLVRNGEERRKYAIGSIMFVFSWKNYKAEIGIDAADGCENEKQRVGFDMKGVHTPIHMS